MTPGIALADAILADIDRDHDGSLSVNEQRAYGDVVLGALELDVDGTRLTLEPAITTFPPLDDVRRGEGTIRLRSAATLPRLATGVHQMSFRNTHQRSRSVYLANALAPRSYQVTVTGQRRDADQTELAIDYVLRAAPSSSTAAWLLGGLIAATAVSALLVRPFRALR
jgi:hypothetical protein